MKTNISWTNESSNPIRFRNKTSGKMGWHCVKVSEGCKNCYAEQMNLSPRIAYGTGLPYSFQSTKEVEPVLIEKELDRLATSKVLSGKMVFLEDMSDLLGGFIPQEMRLRLMDVIEKRPDVIFQILTKRPENAMEFLLDWMDDWPAHVWFGVSVENQKAFDERVNWALRVPAKIHFFSVEPMLEPINFHFPDHPNPRRDTWVIVGGESGPNCRPFEWDWARDLREQCAAANVPFFMKQDNGFFSGNKGRIPNDLWIKEFPDAQINHFQKKEKSGNIRLFD